jgi:mono/diheme cytochrome c family protein
MGEANAEREPPPSRAAVAAAKQRIAAGGAGVRQGRRLFTAEGCDRCHSIAAIGAEGVLGPRLDMLEADLHDTVESIADPRHDITEGYPEKLMPTDFGLGDAELQALAAFVTTAAGGEAGGGDSSGKGRGRGRGRGGRGGSGED